MSIFVYSMLILGAFVVMSLFVYAGSRLGRGWSFKLLFKDFNRKMWMTLSLGAVFFTLYFLVVYFGASYAQQWGPDMIFLVSRNPVLFIYAGLSLFAFLTLSIYLVRMFIKYLYLTRGKDS